MFFRTHLATAPWRRARTALCLCIFLVCACNIAASGIAASTIAANAIAASAIAAEQGSPAPVLPDPSHDDILKIHPNSHVVANPRKVIIGGDINYPPYEFLDEYGKPNGFNVELTMAIAEVMGLDVEIRLGLWQQSRRALHAGEIDVLQGMSHSAPREALFNFSEPFTTVEYCIFARPDSPVAVNMADLAGRTVAVEDGGALHEQVMRQYPLVKLVPTYSHENALRLLAAAETDFALVASTAGRYLTSLHGLNIHNVGTPISLEKYSYATIKGQNKDILDTINSGLDILRRTGKYKEINDKWLSPPEQHALSLHQILLRGAYVFTPLLVLLLGSLAWSRSLALRVADRTKALKEEALQHQKARQELEQKQQLIIHSDRMATLGTMVSGIAHEINNPNGLILLNVNMLTRSYEDAQWILDEHFNAEGDFDMGGLPYSRMRTEIPQMMADMRSSAEHIKHIVQDLKEYVRQDPAANREPIDLNELVRTCLRLLSTTIRHSTDHLTVTYGPNLPKLMGSASRIQQVVVNLLTNACEALPEKSRCLTISTAFDPDTNALVLEVADQGSGIDPMHYPKITDPFFTTKREQGGTGLGLSVSASIVREHCGGLEFVSSLGMGTTVILTLPLPVLTRQEQYGMPNGIAGGTGIAGIAGSGNAAAPDQAGSKNDENLAETALIP